MKLFYEGTMKLIQGCPTLRGLCHEFFSPLSKSRPRLQTAAFSLAACPDTQRRITSHHIYNIQVVHPEEREKGKLENMQGIKL